MSSSEDKRLGAYFVRLMDLQKDQKMGDLSSGEYDSLRKKESAGIISKEDDIRLAEIRTAMKQNRRFPEKVIKYLWMMPSSSIVKLFLKPQNTEVLKV